MQIYDLSVDALSPMYYFLLPSSKIRDATFLFNEEGKSVIAIMSSAGYMYTQLMDESSSAQHGPFYVTNVLEINHEDLKVGFTYLDRRITRKMFPQWSTAVFMFWKIWYCVYKKLQKLFDELIVFSTKWYKAIFNEILFVWFQDSNGQVAGGGVSVYYSHVLQMLFFSYSQGKSFAATVSRSTTEVQRLFPINMKG